MKASLREILVTLLIALIIFGVVQVTLKSFRIEGTSMEPSFHHGQYVLVNKLIYHFHPPQRGDVIIFRNPKNPNQLLIKRVIGLPGEQVEIENGQVYIDGRLLEEPDYIPASAGSYSTPNNVPLDRYFVLGDNREISGDSRAGWTVPRGDIIGKVWLCYWPPREWGLSPRYSAALE